MLNAAPVAGNDQLQLLQNTSITFDYALLNDSDADGDALSISSFTTPTHGTLQDNGGGSFTYTPTSGYLGEDSFTYTIDDGQTHSVSSAGLVGHYRLDETSGATAADASGNGNNGSVLGGAAWTSGKLAGGLNLDGSNDSVQLPALNLNSNTVTLAAWVNRDSQKDWAGILFSRAGNTTAGLNLSTNNQLGYHWNDQEWSFDSGLVVPENEWAHVALVVEPHQATLYVNGQSATNTTNHAIEQFNGVTYLGRDPGQSARYFDGQIDDARIYNRALDAGEIATLADHRTATVDISVNAPFDAAAARSQILAGVSTLKTNWVGRMVAYGPTAYVVADYDDTPGVPAAVIGTMGEGKVAALPQRDLLDMGTFANQGDMGQFYQNTLAWLSGTTSKTIQIVVTPNSSALTWLANQGYTNVSLAGNNYAASLAGADVLVGELGASMSAANLEAIASFVNDGGALFTAEGNLGSASPNRPANALLAQAGIGWASGIGWFGNGTDGLTPITAQADAQKLLAMLDNSAGYSNAEKELAGIVMERIAEVRPTGDSLVAKIDDAFWQGIQSINATPSSTVGDAFEQAMLRREMDLIGDLPPSEVTAHRTAEAVYGAIDPAAPRLANQSVTIDTNTTGVLATGLYAAPGEVVTVTVPSSLVGQGHTLRVNTHWDNISAHNNYRRSPHSVSRGFDIDSTTIEVANAFGGAIYVDVGGQASGTAPNLGDLQLTIDGAIAAPHFVLGETTDAEWIATVRDNPAPYAEFVSEHLAFNVPSAWIRTLDNPTQLMTLWNDIVAFQDWVGGFENTRTGPDRINIDVAISVGLLHAGYPIQGPTSYGARIVDYDALTQNGDWGWFHELGHEMQRQPGLGWGWDNPWTFPGDVEVTVNITANAALEFATTGPDTSGWGYSYYPDLVMGRADTTVHDAGAPNFDDKDPYPFYFQLADGEWGWQGYRDVLSSYVADQQSNPSAMPQNAQQEKDQWLVRWSQQSGYDMTEYMVDNWGLEVSASALSTVAAMNLPSWMPLATTIDDFQIDQGETHIIDTSAGGLGLDGVATFVGVTQPQNGTLTNNGNGAYSYAPTVGGGSDSFGVTYQSSAGNTQTFIIDVTIGNGFLPGDVDLNGTLEMADVTQFITGWRSDTSELDDPGKVMQGDLNLDGTTEFADWAILRNAWIAQGGASLGLGGLLATNQGDYNADGAVDQLDHATWRESFGQTTSGNNAQPLAADGNFDGVVNAVDYAIWRESRGESVVTLPEGLVSVPDAEAARTALLAGVSNIAIVGAPGRVAVFDPPAAGPGQGAFGVIHDGDYSPMVAAAIWGTGKIVAFGHNGYTNFNNVGDNLDTGQFYENSVAWTTGVAGKNQKIVTDESGARTWLLANGYTDVTVSNNWQSLLGTADLLIVELGRNVSASERTAVSNFVQNGGGLITGGTGWGYKSLGSDLETLDGNLVLREAGLAWTDGFRNGTTDATNRSTELANASQALAFAEQFFAGGSGTTDQKEEAGEALQAVLEILPASHPLAIDIANAFAGRAAAIAATPATPVSDPLDQAVLTWESEQLQATPVPQVTAHHTAEDVYGVIPAAAPRVTNTIALDTTQSRWHATGLYAAPGETVTVTVPSSLVNQGYKIRINAHTDNISQRDTWERMPEVHRSFDITQTTMQVASAFGGLLFIDVGSTPPNLGAVNITIEDAVEAPTFVLSQHTDEDWNTTLRDRPAPYGVLVSENLIIVLPKHQIESADLTEPTDLMNWWNDTVQLQDDLASQAQFRTSAELINVDVQNSAGAAHAGFPIQAYEKFWGNLADWDNLRVQGSWGDFHELGHNHQRSWWTFSGDGEVSVNIFSNYALENQASASTNFWAYSADPVQTIQTAINDVSGGGTYSSKSDRWSFWFQLADGFGWDAYQNVFAGYEADSANNPGALPSTDQQEKDQWFTRWSNAVGFDMKRFMVDTWGLSVSQSAINAVAALPDWMPLATNIVDFQVDGNSSQVINTASGGLSMDGTANFVGIGARPDKGTLLDNGNGTFTYTPTVLGGEDSFEVTYQSSAGNTQSFSIAVTIGNGAVPGDVDQDGDLDMNDVTQFIAGWRSDTSELDDTAKLMQGDLNLDGTTNFSDWVILRQAWIAQGGAPLNFAQLLNPGSSSPVAAPAAVQTVAENIIAPVEQAPVEAFPTTAANELLSPLPQVLVAAPISAQPQPTRSAPRTTQQFDRDQALELLLEIDRWTPESEEPLVGSSPSIMAEDDLAASSDSADQDAELVAWSEFTRLL